MQHTQTLAHAVDEECPNITLPHFTGPVWCVLCVCARAGLTHFALVRSSPAPEMFTLWNFRQAARPPVRSSVRPPAPATEDVRRSDVHVCAHTRSATFGAHHGMPDGDGDGETPFAHGAQRAESTRHFRMGPQGRCGLVRNVYTYAPCIGECFARACVRAVTRSRRTPPDAARVCAPLVYAAHTR